MDEDYRVTLGAQSVYVSIGKGFKTYQFSRGSRRGRLDGELVVRVVNGMQIITKYPIQTRESWVMRFVNAEDGWL